MSERERLCGIERDRAIFVCVCLREREGVKEREDISVELNRKSYIGMFVFERER